MTVWQMCMGFGIGLAAAAVLGGCAARATNHASSTPKPDACWVYVGTFTGPQSWGIYRLRLDMPEAFSFPRSCGTSTVCTFRDSLPAAIAAATPAASPIARHTGITRTEPCTRWSQEIDRPATSTFASVLGTKHPYGMPWLSPGP